MSNPLQQTFGDPTAWTGEPRETSLINAFVGTGPSIVPAPWRGAFLAERWIAGRACVVQTAISSTDLLVDASFRTCFCEFTRRYCYKDADAALVALRAWNGRANLLDPGSQSW